MLLGARDSGEGPRRPKQATPSPDFPKIQIYFQPSKFPAIYT
jgi:hypothetical protein